MTFAFGFPRPSGRAAKIVAMCAAAFAVTEEDLLGRSRLPRYVHPRFAMYALIRRHTNLSLLRMSWQLQRDHTSIMHGIERANELLTDPRFKRLYEALDKALSKLSAGEEFHSFGEKPVDNTPVSSAKDVCQRSIVHIRTISCGATDTVV